MGRTQWIAAGIAAVLLLITYWGCPVRPAEMEASFQRGPMETTGLETLIREARDRLDPARLANLASLEEVLNATEEDSARTSILEQLAGEWYRAGEPAISGVYARQIAETVNTEEAWSIAGTTFSLCLQREGIEDKIRQFCASQAEQAYQSAISLDPQDADHRINLAVSYTDYPPRNEPMKGILMLRDLEKQYPENARVYMTLARLAIKTNQLERAVERLETAVELEPNNPDAVCPLAQLYEQLGRPEASTMVSRCTELVQPASR